MWLACKLEICSAANPDNRICVSSIARSGAAAGLLGVSLFFAFLFGFSSVTSAQTLSRADSTIGSIKSLFDNGSYISAELEARRMLEDRTVSDSARVLLEKYLAFSLVAEGKNQPAIEHFVNALRIDSSLTLDPVMTSPKILEVFNTAKEQFRSSSDKELSPSENKVIPRGLIQSGESRGPTFRAILFPGWEQVYEGRETKGYILLGAGAVTAISSIAFDFLRRDARTKYLNASTPDLASSTYKKYDAYYKSEFYSVSAFVLIYAYSELDAFLRLPPYFRMNYSPENRGASLDLRISF
ncbi:MAG: hypothetical protein M1469_09465 [Bacteroidetes bacterium]|nr:hypothetical protein [Bacteroidota bacterium]